MATFTVTTAKNIDELASKAGGDTYNVNGGVLTIDQDSRYGANQTTSTILGPITISSSLGGTVEVDARYVRLIPFNSGSGNVPASGTTISQGGVTGKLIGVWSAINVKPTAVGTTMPTSGFIKVKQVSQVPGYSAGALTGISATATGEDVAGWIELVGQESSTVTVPRLGLFRMRGDWFEIGSTTGDNTSTYQLPTNGSTFYAPGVFVHKGTTGDTDDDYEFYPCAGSLVASASVGTDAVRGKVCWISTAGVLRFGHDGTNADTGYTPPAGRRIRIGNIICHNATSAAKTVNALPNATLATRYDFTTTSAGRIEITKTLLGWYPSFTSAYSVTMDSVGISEALYLNAIAAPMTLTRVGVGQCAAQSQRALQMLYCSQGGVHTDCVWSRAVATDTVTFKNLCNGFTYVRERTFAFTVRTAVAGSSDITRVCNDITYVNPTVGSMPPSWEVGAKLRVTDAICFDRITGNTDSANAMNGLRIQGQDIVIDGVSFGGVENVHPYSKLIQVNGSATQDVTIQNVGTFSKRLDMGSANSCAGVVETAPFAGLRRIRVRRCYVSNNRVATAFGEVDLTNSDFVIENCIGDYSSAAIIKQNGLKVRGLGATPSLAVYAGVYGTHWMDGFSSSTNGWLQLRMYEPNPESASYISITGAAAFNGAGGLILPQVGDTATFEMDWFALGHLSFANTAPVLTGGTAADYTFEYQIDKNDGAGWSVWRTVDAATLSAETGIDAINGLKLKVRVTTTTANTSAINVLTITTDSSTTAQQHQYPLEVATVSVVGLVAGSVVKASKVSDKSVLATGTESSGAFSFTTDYAGKVSLSAKKASSAPFYQPWHGEVTTVLGSTVTATALQQLD